MNKRRAEPKSLCVSIETTGPRMGVSLYDFSAEPPRRRASYLSKNMPRQSDHLVPTLDRLLKGSRYRRADIGLIAVDVGPGSFTGVRVGVSVARAIAQALDVPVVGVSSLEAVAWESSNKRPTVIAATVPALPGEIYYAVYRREKQNGETAIETLEEPRWGSLNEFEARVRRHPAAVKRSGHPHPNSIAEIAIRRYKKSDDPAKFHYEKTVPLYLQPSWAERKVLKPSAPASC